ncbi:unnamed protein product [Aphanomyces euteiches]
MTDLSLQQSSEKEMALKKLQRTSKHLEDAKTDLYFKATVEKLDQRQRDLNAKELKVQSDQEKVVEELFESDDWSCSCKPLKQPSCKNNCK